MDAPQNRTGEIRPLDANERRVLGVLIEKAKTTPDQYPLSLNGLVVGCNQKSNRDPVMTLDEEQVMRAVAGLRKCGAMAEVFGSGKIPRYRHLAYEWLGVEKEELAILGELLLRGEQTEGDLRGHLDRLADRGLVVWLSPPGRGRMLTHGLLPAEKLEKVRSQLGLAGGGVAEPGPPEEIAERGTEPPPVAETPAPRPAAPARDDVADRVAALERTVADLRDRLARLEADLGG